MNEAKHTSGPFRYDPDEREVVTQDGRPLCGVFDTAEGLEGSDAEADANGSLFAESPVLLAILSEICRIQAENYGNATKLHIAMIDAADKARAVIASCSGVHEEHQDDVDINVNGKVMPLYGTTLRYADAVRMAGFSQPGATVTYSGAFADKNGSGGNRDGILMPDERITVAHRGTVVNVAYTGNA